jgi:hypothetical protein
MKRRLVVRGKEKRTIKIMKKIIKKEKLIVIMILTKVITIKIIVVLVKRRIRIRIIKIRTVKIRPATKVTQKLMRRIVTRKAKIVAIKVI